VSILALVSDQWITIRSSHHVNSPKLLEGLDSAVEFIQQDRPQLHTNGLTLMETDIEKNSSSLTKTIDEAGDTKRSLSSDLGEHRVLEVHVGLRSFCVVFDALSPLIRPRRSNILSRSTFT